MRSEREMHDSIFNIAKEDNRIRAVFEGGSRADPHIPGDIFQDYDVVLVVKETASFRRDKSWIDLFGQRLYMQYPEDSVYYPSDADNYYFYSYDTEEAKNSRNFLEHVRYLPEDAAGVL